VVEVEGWAARGLPDRVAAIEGRRAEYEAAWAGVMMALLGNQGGEHGVN